MDKLMRSVVNDIVEAMSTWHTSTVLEIDSEDCRTIVKVAVETLQANYDLIPKGKVIILPHDAEPMVGDLLLDLGDNDAPLRVSNDGKGWYDACGYYDFEPDDKFTIIKRGNSLVIMEEK